MLKTINTTCPRCHRNDTIDVDADAYKRWTTGGLLVQHAFPQLSPSQREQLITGFCDPCWDAPFGDD